MVTKRAYTVNVKPLILLFSWVLIAKFKMAQRAPGPRLPPTPRGLPPPRGRGLIPRSPTMEGPFSASRLPNMHPRPLHQQQSPYSRPQNPISSGHSMTTPSASDSASVIEMYRELIQEVRQGRMENKRIGEDVKKMSQIVARLEENYNKIRDNMKEQTEATFSIETSIYKVTIITVFMIQV